MARKETRVQKIVRLTARRFPSLGSGVDIEQVVRFILAKRSAVQSQERQEIGDDARDDMSTVACLQNISRTGLSVIKCLGHKDMQRRLRDSKYPFKRLGKKTREALLHLPPSWIRGGAEWLLGI